MPRETICGQTMPIDIEVAWGARSEYVQIGSVHNEGQTAGFIIINEWLAKAGMPVIDVAELRRKLDEHDSTRAVFSVPHGWHATFTERSDVNRMIAVLRRARDHAFGKDE